MAESYFSNRQTFFEYLVVTLKLEDDCSKELEKRLIQDGLDIDSGMFNDWNKVYKDINAPAAKTRSFLITLYINYPESHKKISKQLKKKFDK